VPKEGTDFGTSGSRFAFTSHRFDTELDLYYAGGRMYSPTIGRFISQDALSLDPNNPDSWNLFRYALANPTRYVDPTGHTAEGAELQGVLRETKDYFQSQAKGTGVTGFLKGVGFGILSGAVGIVESAVGLVDEGATVAYTVPGVDVMGDPSGVESREEIKQQVADLKQTYHVIKEEGFFNAASRIAGNAKDTLIAAAKGDPQAIAKVTSFATEIVGPTAALKGSGALGAMRRGAKELVEGAGRAVRHGWDEAAGALRRGGDDLAEAGRTFRIGERLPDGRIAGEGPGAALANAPQRPGGYRTFDVDAHRRLSPGSNRAPGHGVTAAEGRVQSHHFIQDEWAKRNVPGYESDDAAAILLRSASGEPHAAVSSAQRMRRSARVAAGETPFGGDIKELFQKSYRDLIAAGVPPEAARRAARRAYKYFDSLDAFTPSR
jgi:RHS repeat-associated protein